MSHIGEYPLSKKKVLSQSFKKPSVRYFKISLPEIPADYTVAQLQTDAKEYAETLSPVMNRYRGSIPRVAFLTTYNAFISKIPPSGDGRDVIHDTIVKVVQQRLYDDTRKGRHGHVDPELIEDALIEMFEARHGITSTVTVEVPNTKPELPGSVNVTKTPRKLERKKPIPFEEMTERPGIPAAWLTPSSDATSAIPTVATTQRERTIRFNDLDDIVAHIPPEMSHSSNFFFKVLEKVANTFNISFDLAPRAVVNARCVETIVATLAKHGKVPKDVPQSQRRIAKRLLRAIEFHAEMHESANPGERMRNREALFETVCDGIARSRAIASGTSRGDVRGSPDFKSYVSQLRAELFAERVGGISGVHADTFVGRLRDEVCERVLLGKSQMSDLVKLAADSADAKPPPQNKKPALKTASNEL